MKIKKHVKSNRTAQIKGVYPLDIQVHLVWSFENLFVQETVEWQQRLNIVMFVL